MSPVNKENYIVTVKGPIPKSSLGYCQSHEHLFLADGQSAKINPSLRLDDFDKTVKELFLYKKVGGMSIVDAQPLGCGRAAELQLEASKKTGINIIASTGFHKLIFYPKNHWIHKICVDELSEIFIGELTIGMHINADYKFPSQRISALPGVIKIATDTNGVDASYKKLVFAAAKASIITGTSILCHVETRESVMEQIQLLTDCGVPSKSIIICHLDRVVKDVKFHLEVAKTGVYLEYDTIGRFKYHSDEEEAELIIDMVSRGYEDKILIGLDTTRERMKSYGGSIGLDYIRTTFIPLLKSCSLADKTIKKFVVDNPAEAFSKYKLV